MSPRSSSRARGSGPDIVRRGGQPGRPPGWSTSGPSTSTSRPAPASGWSGSSPASTSTGRPPTTTPTADAKPGIAAVARAATGGCLVHESPEDAPWLDGVDQLCDPSALTRFVVSRTLYRRFGRYAWWLLVPFGVALLLRVAVTPWLLGHLGNSLPGRAIRHAHTADLNDQLVVALVVALVVLIVLAVVLGLLSRRMWSILGGGALEEVRTEAAANDTARDDARRLVGRGYAGLITAATFRSELTNLGTGFYANVGATAEVVAEHRGRFGLPPVFLHSQWVSWVEIESGAELHVRLLLAHNELPSPSRLERLVTRGRDRGLAPPLAGGLLPGGRLVAARHRPPPGPPAHPAGAALGRPPPSSSPGSSTSSTPSPRPCAVASTPSSSSCPSGPARPPAPWWPWPASPSSPSAGASCAASAGPGGWPWSCWPAPSCSTWWRGPTSRSRSSPGPSWSSCW